MLQKVIILAGPEFEVLKKYSHSLGGVRFSARTGTELNFSSCSPVYERFVEEEQTDHEEIVTKISFDQVPTAIGMTRIYDNEENWSMLRDGKDYFLTFCRPGEKKPYMAGRFGPELREVTAFCPEIYSTGQTTITNPIEYPLDQILLMYYLSKRGGSIVHAAGMVIEGKGCLFPGRSGAGKTTISTKFAPAKEVDGLSDDRIIVRKSGESFRIFGTPWPGNALIAENKSAPLTGIYFLAQSSENKVERITATEAFHRFVPVLSIPWYDKEAINGIFSFIEELIGKIPSYVLYFTPEIEVKDLFELSSLNG